MVKLPIRIVWDECRREQWTGLLSRVPNSCYMNTWAYGEAVNDSTRMVPRRGLIYRGTTPIGLVQAFQTLYFLKTYVVTKVFRGPQWFRGDVSDEEQVLTFSLMQDYFGNSYRKSFLLLPELEDTTKNRNLMESLGLKRAFPGYQTSFLNIKPDLENIRSNFKDDWRQSLESAENKTIEVSCKNNYDSVEWLITRYTENINTKTSTGPNSNFIQTYLKHTDEAYLMLKAERDLAGAFIITHGISATYMMGWCSPEGRQLKASHLLLWKAIETLKNMEIESLDLGTTDTKSSLNINELREGMGGKVFNPVGVYA